MSNANGPVVNRADLVVVLDLQTGWRIVETRIIREPVRDKPYSCVYEFSDIGTDTKLRRFRHYFVISSDINCCLT
ncbi:hypothetical protein DPMN_008441 [Dreissena polymorpha]|uniref:Uncharacterized protein n=1 Tax=Dreissena polymorpha TaxID=45954 RepID=A0A9D4RWY4_DREPO|nr:hypothetical protein DPMN_008441 [Dreissena polymorpha]